MTLSFLPFILSVTYLNLCSTLSQGKSKQNKKSKNVIFLKVMSLMINVLFWTQISLSNYNANATTKFLRDEQHAYVFISSYASQSHLENECFP